MRDGTLRRTVKRVARWAFEADLVVERAVRRARGERPYRLGGECRRCAACCEAPAIHVGRPVFHLPRLRRLFLWWQERVNGFVLTASDPATRTFVFRCTHFDRATRSCDSYDSRPGMCRDYPRLLLWQPSPDFLPGCGYRAVLPNAAGLREALESRPLDPRQRARLAKALHLEE